MPKVASSPKRQRAFSGKKKNPEDDLNDSDVDPSFRGPAAPVGCKAPLREYYPLHHQADWDEGERATIDPRRANLNLNCLTEGNPSRQPPHTVACMVKCAILGSPKQQLTLKEIRIALRRRFHFYANRITTGWCNTIRHGLSMSNDFQHTPRQRTRGDHGDWWYVTENAALPVVTPDHSVNQRTQEVPSDAPKGNSISLQRRAEENPWVHWHHTFFPYMEPTPFPPSSKQKRFPDHQTAFPTQFGTASISGTSASPSPLPTPVIETHSLLNSPSGMPFPLPGCEYLAQEACHHSSPVVSSFTALPALRSLGLLNVKGIHSPPPKYRRVSPYITVSSEIGSGEAASS
ncbi:hypothetical protein M422DRAFT_23729 [Sphaerobolus stellatus SS14]|nr:hypothetical protein M422DRAFT_23729 [Sphaerobolus stellatus SS14]